MRVVFDTNIYISAMLFGGLPRAIIQLVIEGHGENFISPAIRIETEHVLRGKFVWTGAEIEGRFARILSVSTLVVPRITLQNIVVDEDDHRILECAVEARANYIVSGDRHLLELGAYADIFVVNARQFHTLCASRQIPS